MSAKAIGRLAIYRRLLSDLHAEGVHYVYSHELGHRAGCTAEQVRRDLMTVGYSGSATRGYDVTSLMEGIADLLDAPEGQEAALVGVGNLGRAILAYFSGRRPKLTITAAFDVDADKTARVIHGCRCYPMSELDGVIQERRIDVGIITVPASAAQGVADQLVGAGVRGLLNFAPVNLRVRPYVCVENIDITVSLEKVAFFARQGSLHKEIAK